MSHKLFFRSCNSLERISQRKSVLTERSPSLLHCKMPTIHRVSSIYKCTDMYSYNPHVVNTYIHLLTSYSCFPSPSELSFFSEATTAICKQTSQNKLNDINLLRRQKLHLGHKISLHAHFPVGARVYEHIGRYFLTQRH